MHRWGIVAALAACAENTEGEATTTPSVTDPGTSTTPTTATLPTTTDATVLAASCALTDNSLRVSCDVSLADAGPVQLRLESDGLPTRTFTQTGSTTQTLLGWGLQANTEYRWSIGEASGSVSTGNLPPELLAATIETTGVAIGFDAVLFPMRCVGTDYFTMIDGSGNIVWYEPNDVYFTGTMAGYDWQQETRSVLSVNGGQFQEQSVAGEVLLELSRGVDFEHELHHDVDRWGDLRYLLFEYPVGGLNVDGVDIFDGDTLVGTFLLEDHYTIPSIGTGDWSHANAVKVTDSGEVILSLHTFSSVLSFDGDPASPTFLDVNWVANGLTDGLPEADYLPVAGALEGFELQHNVSRVGDDLWVFDNRGQPRSRAIRMAMDHTAGTLAVTGSWSVGTVCPNQGGAIPLDGGGVLASCANTGEVLAFAEGSVDPNWTLFGTCGEDGGFGTLPILRGIPIVIE